MALNEKLSFSWGHIIAFFALIVISYFSFLGSTYLFNNTIGEIICVVVVNILLITFFIGAQQFKSVDRDFTKKIKWERMLFFMAPFILAVAMVPAAHFWTVFDNRDNIESKFSTAINNSKEMFSQYEKYAQERIDSYSAKVNKTRSSAVRKADKKLALTLQLNGENYVKLKELSVEWINKASDATVWNASMIGNIQTINNAVTKWHSQLVEFTRHMMTEEEELTIFDANESCLNAITGSLDEIKNEYKTLSAPNLYAILMYILSYILLIFPYWVQRRNVKSLYRLIGGEKMSEEFLSINNSKDKSGKRANQEAEKTASADVDDDDDDYALVESKKTTPASNENDDDDDYTVIMMN